MSDTVVGEIEPPRHRVRVPLCTSAQTIPTTAAGQLVRPATTGLGSQWGSDLRRHPDHDGWQRAAARGRLRRGCLHAL